MMNWKDYLNYLTLLKNLTKKILLLSLLFFISLLAQENKDIVKANNRSTVVKMEPTKSAWGAVLRSALLPGLGQIYNESYWKAPLIWAIMASQTYYWIQNNKSYQDLRIKFRNTGQLRFKSARDRTRDYRDKIFMYGILVYLLQLVDAYVEASLFDFDVTENTFTGQPQVSLRINF